ncbi:arabinogalactan protein 20-like [Carya illinoinensis]|uniref:Arabinogalactan peptide, AGP n=2 Tax=Carya illinoinensis TaxID=32201 RepID=A0A922FN95_CARIL|nr:arabinogalactan protein 20-like [Carya illinoinensis]KAG6723700.1 hypothetical protein I3842_03G221300 [Carya illinoinensis]
MLFKTHLNRTPTATYKDRTIPPNPSHLLNPLPHTARSLNPNSSFSFLLLQQFHTDILKMNSMRSYAFSVIAFVLSTLLLLSEAQTLAPAPGGPFSDGAALDQGIAYVLLLVALAVTYLVH